MDALRITFSDPLTVHLRVDGLELLSRQITRLLQLGYDVNQKLGENNVKLSEAISVFGEVKRNLEEASTEILDRIKQLQSTDPDLSPDGAKLVDEVKAISQALANIVQNPPQTTDQPAPVSESAVPA